MCPIENLKTSATPNKRLRTHEHYQQNDGHQNTRRICPSIAQTKQSRTRRQQPFRQRVIVSVQHRIVQHNCAEIQQMHYRMQ